MTSDELNEYMQKKQAEMAEYQRRAWISAWATLPSSAAIGWSAIELVTFKQPWWLYLLVLAFGIAWNKRMFRWVRDSYDRKN